MMMSYHDSRIQGVITDIDNDSLGLIINDENDSRLIRFLGVKKCRIDNFVIGNIILDVKLYSGFDDAEKLKDSTAFKSLFYISNSKKSAEYFKKIVNEVSEGKLSYVEVIPSYGCTVIIVCEKITEVVLKEPITVSIK